MAKYFYNDGLNKFGPFNKDELLSQNITRDTEIWKYGLDNWIKISEIEDFRDIINNIPPSLDKNKLIFDKPLILSKNNNLNKSNKKKITIKLIWLGGIVILISLFFLMKNYLNKSTYTEVVNSSFTTQENFDLYVEKYYRDLGYYGIFPQRPKVTIIKLAKLDQLEKTAHIHAISFGFEQNDKIEIYINERSWQNFTKPMKYFLIYHELSHDVLNKTDLETTPDNIGKIMYPEISKYENKTMDEFIETAHDFFKSESIKYKK